MQIAEKIINWIDYQKQRGLEYINFLDSRKFSTNNENDSDSQGPEYTQSDSSIVERLPTIELCILCEDFWDYDETLEKLIEALKLSSNISLYIFSNLSEFMRFESVKGANLFVWVFGSVLINEFSQKFSVPLSVETVTPVLTDLQNSKRVLVQASVHPRDWLRDNTLKRNVWQQAQALMACLDL